MSWFKSFFQYSSKNITGNLVNVLRTLGSSGGPVVKGEEKLSSILRQKFPKAQTIHVEDISGGCGAMYEVNVVSSEFKGLNLLKQHRLVTDAIKAEVKEMHGVRINTAVAQNDS